MRNPEPVFFYSWFFAADSWPDSLDDSNARKDWGWAPMYDLDATVDEMFALVRRQLIAEGKTLNS
ncbi:unnamed protein product [Gongylonema pulchrum]|uniref:NAD-dependent epimerase/dehydratase n=1 Tax=Gongylonema pulchrum TaxID=637853 RepID=A0A183DCQ1_9BILA|nr:unnamed protein product [Gongylonema pulchrum]